MTPEDGFRKFMSKHGDIVRLLLSGFISYLIALVYNVCIVQRSLQVKYTFHVVCGTLICYYNFGTESSHLIVTCFVAWTASKLLGPTRVMVGFNFVFSMGYLLAGYYQKQTEGNITKITWTMPQCVLTLSIIAFSFDVYDGANNRNLRKKSKNVINEDTALEDTPSFLELLSKIYFPPTVLIGPQIRFADFIQFSNGNQNLLPYCWKQSLMRFMAGLLYFGLYQFGQIYWPSSYLQTDDFKSYGFFIKFSILALVAKLILCKYIGAWLISEGACILYGISRDPKTGLINRCFNMSLVHYETTPTFGGLVESFNISTNNFAARYIFKRLKFIGSKIVSQFMTLIFLAIWHGFSTGYYHSFLLEMAYMKMEKDIGSIVIKYRTRNQTINRLLNRTSVRWLTYLLLRLHVIYLFGYAFIPFGLLHSHLWVDALRQVYFFGHIYIAWFPISMLLGL